MNKVTFKKNKKNPYVYDVQFSGLTRGEILAMYYALDNHDTPVGRDVFACFQHGLRDAGDSQIDRLGE